MRRTASGLHSRRGVSSQMKNRTTDQLLWNLLFGIYAYPILLLGHKLKVFTMLAEQPLTRSELMERLAIRRRPAEAILAGATSLGLLELRGGRYALTPGAGGDPAG